MHPGELQEAGERASDPLRRVGVLRARLSVAGCRESVFVVALHARAGLEVVRRDVETVERIS
jgi:hypothetical protein